MQKNPHPIQTLLLIFCIKRTNQSKGDLYTKEKPRSLLVNKFDKSESVLEKQINLPNLTIIDDEWMPSKISRTPFVLQQLKKLEQNNRKEEKDYLQYEYKHEHDTISSSILQDINIPSKIDTEVNLIGTDQLFRTQINSYSKNKYLPNLLDRMSEQKERNNGSRKPQHGDNLFEIEKKTTLYLEEDKVKPFISSEKLSYHKKNLKTSTIQEEPVKISSKDFMANKTFKKCMKDGRSKQSNKAERKGYVKDLCYQCSTDLRVFKEADKNHQSHGFAFKGPDQKRRVSSAEPHPYSSLSEVKEEERDRRMSTGTNSNLSLGETRKYNSCKTAIFKSQQYSTTSILSTSTLSTSSKESVDISEDLSLSPPEYLNFPEEADSVDEFFLLPEDILNVDFKTVCESEELARFSNDMKIILDTSDHNSSYLKAAKASYEWNTLWIYRGKNRFIIFYFGIVLP